MKNVHAAEQYTRRRSPREEDLRGPYLRDQTAIIHSLPFRRLKHKTQVFFAPENDHICTRIEHVMHVATIATTIARGLNACGWQLDEELAGAIGLGHDLGHAPFGHSGEAILDELVKPLGGGFMHEVNGLRVVDHLANDGQGLNLTWAVRDGIICHNGEKFEPSLCPSSHPNLPEAIRDRSCQPSTWEGCIVRYADKIAYLGRDLEDAIVAGLIAETDIPERVRLALGAKNGDIIRALVLDLIDASRAGDAIRFSSDRFDLINELKQFNYRHIYFHPRLRDYAGHCRLLLGQLFAHLSEALRRWGRDWPAWRASPVPLDQAFGRHLERTVAFYDAEGGPSHQPIVDYLAGMTDLYALAAARQILFPEPIRFAGH